MIDISEEAIILQTDFSGEFAKIDIIDGKCVYKDKEFLVDRARPFLLKKRKLFKTTIKPLYFLKWDKVEPAHFIVDEKEIDGEQYAELKDKYVLKTIEPAFPDKSKDDKLPAMLRETHDMRFLRHMKKYAGEGQPKTREFPKWLLIPMFLIAAGGITWLLYAMKIFH